MTAICCLANRPGVAADSLPAMLGRLADYGSKAWRQQSAGVALGAVGAPGAAPLAEARGLWMAADARLFWRLLRNRLEWLAGKRSLRRNYWLIDSQFARRAPPRSHPPSRQLSVYARQLHRLRRLGIAERVEREVAQGALCGVEVRYPLLDRRLVEFALSQPPEAPLSRAGYVDLQRLLERLGDVEDFRRRPRPLPMWAALEFLDFQAPLAQAQAQDHSGGIHP